MRERVGALLGYVLHGTEWFLYDITDPTNFEDFIYPVGLHVEFALPFSHTGHGVCDMHPDVSTPTEAAIYLLTQALEGMYHDFDACEAAATFAVGLALNQLAQTN